MKCDVKRCKAACCYNVPLEKGFLTAYKKKIVNPVIELKAFTKKENAVNFKSVMERPQYLMITDKDIKKNKCPFLRDDFKCNIYDSRPALCRKFGTSDERFLNCSYLSGHKTDNSINAILDDLTFLSMRYMKGDKLI